MEALSPTMEEGRLVKWMKQEGDSVSTGDPLAEVETDKAIMELAARGEGVLRKRLLEEGGTAPVGTLVGVIAAEDEDIEELVAGAGGKSGGGAKEGSAKAGAAKEGGAKKGGEKPAADAKAARRGEKDAVPEEAVAEGEERAGSPVPDDADQAQGEASTPPQEKAPATRRTAPPAGQAQRRGGGAGNGDGGDGADGGRARSSPLARRLASERGVDLAEVQGSGPGGRIVKRDIEAAAEAGPAERPAAARSATREEEYEDVPLTQMRRTIARRLAESIGPVPTFYLTAELDMERASEMRSAMAELGAEFKVSFNDIILKAVAIALAQHPECNAHWLGDRMRRFNRVHLGMAVAIDEGLITPVIFDADRKGLREIAAESRDLAKRARDRKLKPEEYTGSTFSVSNLGMFGIDHFTAIINPPEAGILAIGAIEDRPIRTAEGIGFRKRLRLTMSCDHRVIDGATGAKFLQTLRRLIENPLAMVY